MADSERNGDNAAPRPATWTWPPSRRALTLLAALRWPSPRVLSTLGPLRAGKSRFGFEGRWGLRAVLRCCPRRAPCSGCRVRARAPASRRGLRPLPVRARRARGSSRGRPAPPRSSPRKQRPDSAGRAAGSPRADAAVPHVLGFFTPNPLLSPRDRPLLAVNGPGSFVSGVPGRRLRPGSTPCGATCRRQLKQCLRRPQIGRLSRLTGLSPRTFA